jgi:hypothetical protein
MIDWLLSVLWYSSFLAVATSALALIRPIRILRLFPRRRPMTLGALATVVIVAMIVLIPSPKVVAQHISAHDRITPAYHFREMHTRSVAARPSRVLEATKAVTASEIALFQTFTTIRRFGRAGPESILNAPEHRPILDVATRSGFLLLAESDNEVVVGTIVVAPPGLAARVRAYNAEWFQQVDEAGIVKATMNFAVQAEGDERTRLTTETRVFGTDETSVRRFTPYWRTIFPGSWILRVTWLDAIAKRAER